MGLSFNLACSSEDVPGEGVELFDFAFSKISLNFVGVVAVFGVDGEGEFVVASMARRFAMISSNCVGFLVSDMLFTKERKERRKKIVLLFGVFVCVFK